MQRHNLDSAAAGRLQEVLDREEAGTHGYLPDHLPLDPSRSAMDERLRARRFFDPDSHLEAGQYEVTTIFPPDQRLVFSDTSFPWCTTGRVATTGGWGSGALVGPRHLLCTSHMMAWNPDNTVNQVTFVPSFFDGNAPFGNSGIVHWYAYRKVVGPNLTVADVEEDFVALVLEQRLGDLCGWMGTRGYYQGWDGLAVWDHIGYPADLTGGQRPTFQESVAIDSTVPPTILVPVVWGDEDLQQRADIWPGQSGGPFFPWFDASRGPRVRSPERSESADQQRRRRIIYQQPGEQGTHRFPVSRSALGRPIRRTRKSVHDEAPRRFALCGTHKGHLCHEGVR